MKAKSLIVIGLTFIMLFILLTGCGSDTKSANGEVQINDIQLTEPTSEEFQIADQPMMMKVESIDGNEITAIVMMQNFDRGQRPNMEVPEGKEGEFPEKPEGGFPEKPEGEFPEKPEGGFPEKPEGEMPEMSQGKPPVGENGGRQSVTFTIKDETQIVQQSESGNVEATLEQITTDNVLQVQLDENKEAISITIMSIPKVQ